MHEEEDFTIWVPLLIIWFRPNEMSDFRWLYLSSNVEIGGILAAPILEFCYKVVNDYRYEEIFLR